MALHSRCYQLIVFLFALVFLQELEASGRKHAKTDAKKDSSTKPVCAADQKCLRDMEVLHNSVFLKDLKAPGCSGFTDPVIWTDWTVLPSTSFGANGQKFLGPFRMDESAEKNFTGTDGLKPGCTGRLFLHALVLPGLQKGLYVLVNGVPLKVEEFPWLQDYHGACGSFQYREKILPPFVCEKNVVARYQVPVNGAFVIEVGVYDARNKKDPLNPRPLAYVFNDVKFVPDKYNVEYNLRDSIILQRVMPRCDWSREHIKKSHWILQCECTGTHCTTCDYARYCGTICGVATNCLYFTLHLPTSSGDPYRCFPKSATKPLRRNANRISGPPLRPGNGTKPAPAPPAMTTPTTTTNNTEVAQVVGPGSVPMELQIENLSIAVVMSTGHGMSLNLTTANLSLPEFYLELYARGNGDCLLVKHINFGSESRRYFPSAKVATCWLQFRHDGVEYGRGITHNSRHGELLFPTPATKLVAWWPEDGSAMYSYRNQVPATLQGGQDDSDWALWETLSEPTLDFMGHFPAQAAERGSTDASQPIFRTVPLLLEDDLAISFAKVEVSQAGSAVLQVLKPGESSHKQAIRVAFDFDESILAAAGSTKSRLNVLIAHVRAPVFETTHPLGAEGNKSFVSDLFSVEARVENSSLWRFDFDADLAWSAGRRVKAYGDGDHAFVCNPNRTSDGCRPTSWNRTQLHCSCSGQKAQMAALWERRPLADAAHRRLQRGIVINVPESFYLDAPHPGHMFVLIFFSACIALFLLALFFDYRHCVDSQVYLVWKDVPIVAPTSPQAWIWIFFPREYCSFPAATILTQLRRARREGVHHHSTSLFSFLHSHGGFFHLVWLALIRDHPLRWMWVQVPWMSCTDQCLKLIAVLGFAIFLTTVKHIYSNENLGDFLEEFKNEGVTPEELHDKIADYAFTVKRFCDATFISIFSMLFTTIIGAILLSLLSRKLMRVDPRSDADMKRRVAMTRWKRGLGKLLAVCAALSSFLLLFAVYGGLSKCGNIKLFMSVTVTTSSVLVITPTLRAFAVGLMLFSARRVHAWDGFLSLFPTLMSFLHIQFPGDVAAQVQNFCVGIGLTGETELARLSYRPGKTGSWLSFNVRPTIIEHTCPNDSTTSFEMGHAISDVGRLPARLPTTNSLHSENPSSRPTSPSRSSSRVRFSSEQASSTRENWRSRMDSVDSDLFPVTRKRIQSWGVSSTLSRSSSIPIKSHTSTRSSAARSSASESEDFDETFAVGEERLQA